MPVVPSLNPHIKTLSTSPTLKINQKIKKLKEQGVQVAHFGFGQSPFPAPDLLSQSLQECATQNGYLPTQGLEELREAVSQWMDEAFKIKCKAPQVFIGPGSKECIFDLLYLLEGTVLIPQGSWVSYKPMCKILDKPYEFLETTFENNYLLQAESLEAYAKKVKGPKILILNSPSNPSGQVYDKDTLEALSAVCKKHEIIVISDEIYGLVQFEEKPYYSIAHYYPEGTIVTNGLSKSFSAGGYRLGFAVIPENFLPMADYYNAMISETYSAVSTPTQYAALSVFNQFDKIKPYISCCNHIHRWVLEHSHQVLVNAGFACPKPQGAFYLLAHLEGHRDVLAKMGIHDSHELCDYVLDRYQVAVLPASYFGFDKSFLGFRAAPVDYSGVKVLPFFCIESAKDKLGEWFPNVKLGLDQLQKFGHSLNNR